MVGVVSHGGGGSRGRRRLIRVTSIERGGVREAIHSSPFRGECPG